MPADTMGGGLDEVLSGTGVRPAHNPHTELDAMT